MAHDSSDEARNSVVVEDGDIESKGSTRKEVGTEETAIVPELPAQPFSVFTKREKWVLIAMVGFAGFFRCGHTLVSSYSVF